MSLATTAPGRLELVRAFVNTRNIEAGTDAISTAEGLGRWLRQARLLTADDAVHAADISLILGVREAIREALAANHGGVGLPAGALAVLNDAAARSALSVSFTGPGWVCAPRADGVDAAIGTLLAIIVGAMADGTWSRLKVCLNDACRWAFYDTSRARSGKWCAMGICGNRAKQQAWRQRRTSTGAAGL